MNKIFLFLIICFLSVAQSNELEKWDKIVDDLEEKQPLDDGDNMRINAYLYWGQRQFADAAKGSGTFDPISLHVVQLFYPDYRPDSANLNDSFSNELTAKIAKQIDARFKEEQKQIRLVDLPEGKNLWEGKKPYLGQRIPTMKPWILDSANQFRLTPPPPPESSFWKEQFAITKRKTEEATDAQKKRVLYWAGMAPKGSGHWGGIAQKYMTDHQVPLEKQLEVREKLAAILMDSSIAAFDSKYTYMVKRPFMLDPTFKPYIETPNHPSYPSIHSTGSMASAILLSYYFPENQQEWERLAEEAGQSRIWGGIHYPADHQAGKELGTKIANQALRKSR